MGTIRTVQNNLLTSTAEELIEYKVYDKDGVFIDTHSENVLLQIPSVAIPLYKDMTVEYLRPLKRVIQEVNLKNINVVNSNPSFNYGSKHYVIGGNVPNGAVVEATSGIPKLSGSHVYRNPDSAVRLASTSFAVNVPARLLQNDSTDSNVKSDRSMKVGFSYYIDNDSTTSIDYFLHVIVLIVHPNSPSSNNILWNWSENKWEQLSAFGDDHALVVRDTAKKKWQNWNNIFPPAIVQGEEFNEIRLVIFGTSYEDSTQQSNHNYTYFDNVFISNEIPVTSDASKFIIEREQTSSNTLTGIYENKNLQLSNDLGETTIFDQGFDGNFFTAKNGSATTFKLDELISQEILNDYREYVKRFEGTIFNTNPQPIPIALHNKLWINFTNSSEEVSAYIDSLDYSLKRNEYKLVAHIPNQDDDVASSYSVRFE